MADILKFPVTAFERIAAVGKRHGRTGPASQEYYGGCAASAWLATPQAQEIAFRVALWVADRADFRHNGYNVVLPAGWHFEMIHGRPPSAGEDAGFWQEMQGTTDAFRTGFTRGLVGAVALVLGEIQPPSA